MLGAFHLLCQHDIAFSGKTNGLLIEIFLSQSLAYDIFITEGNWLNVSIRNGLVNRTRIASRKISRFMSKLKTHQVESTGQVSIRLRRPIEKWTHKLVMDPPWTPDRMTEDARDTLGIF